MATQTSPPDQSLGRPRDSRIDEAVLRATRELLVEVGYARLSLTAIALRAGTTRPTLSRRWPSLAHLVHEAAFPRELNEPATKSVDVRTLVAGSLAAFSTPVARAAAPGLVAAMTADPSLHQNLLRRFAASLGGIERPLLDIAAGAAFFALMTHSDDFAAGPGAEAWIDRVTHLITEAQEKWTDT